MLRPAIIVVPLLALGVGLIPLGCTQDFDIFSVQPSGGPTTASAGGAVGSSSTSDTVGSSMTGTPGVGGAGGAPPTTVSSTSTSTTSTTPTTSSGGTTEANCNDGVDNDGDSSTDCADGDCKSVGYTCTDTPEGWTGPVVLFEGAPGTTPSCPPELWTPAFTGFSGITVPDFSCNACTCDPAAVTCKVANADFFPALVCGGSPTSYPQPQNGACQALSPPAASVKIDKPDASAASKCAPKGGGLQGAPLPPATWKLEGVGCAPAAKGGGCNGAAQTCTPPAPAGFDKVCVYKQGDAICPGAYPNKHTYFGDKFVDGRKCTDCACGSANGDATCTVQTTGFQSADCSGNGLALANNNQCVPGVPGVTGRSFTSTTTVTTAPTCSPSGGVKQGTVGPDTSTAFIVCCKN